VAFSLFCTLLPIFNSTYEIHSLFYFIADMARGSIGRDRMVSGVLGIDTQNHQQPAAHHQEHVQLNDELLAVI
jgi:hypothetical protein